MGVLEKYDAYVYRYKWTVCIHIHSFYYLLYMRNYQYASANFQSASLFSHSIHMLFWCTNFGMWFPTGMTVYDMFPVPNTTTYHCFVLKQNISKSHRLSFRGDHIHSKADVVPRATKKNGWNLVPWCSFASGSRTSSPLRFDPILFTMDLLPTPTVLSDGCSTHSLTYLICLPLRNKGWWGKGQWLIIPYQFISEEHQGEYVD